LDQEPFLAPRLDIIVVSQVTRIHLFPLLDTGAGVTFFGTEDAEALGIDWRNCPTIDIAGMGGMFKGYAADVKLVIPAASYAWPARFVFSPAIDSSPYPVLGYNGFFEHFEVRFKGPRFSVFLK